MKSSTVPGSVAPSTPGCRAFCYAKETLIDNASHLISAEAESNSSFFTLYSKPLFPVLLMLYAKWVESSF